MNEKVPRSLDDLLEKEIYVYQGKTYTRKRLYRTSSLKTMFIAMYLILMVVVIGGVAVWSLGVPFEIPPFLLGIDDASPTVQVRQSSPQAPRAVAATATTTGSDGQVQTTAEVVDELSTSTAGTSTRGGAVQTSAEIIATTTSTATNAAPSP